jgi:glycosyltransferase involved in cell wall biosynthesis
VEESSGKTPYFSVLVPTYNQARYVGAALDSLLAQTDPDWEAVVVNDGSTDDSESIVASRARQDSRIRLFTQATRGTAEALNTCLRESRGEWICWLSSDGLFESGKLDTQRQWIRGHPGRHFFHTHFRCLDDATGRLTDPTLSRRIPGEQWHLIDMLAGTSVHSSSVCVAREALRDVGGFDARLRYAQDYDIWLRLLAHHRAVFISERTCVTRIHADQSAQTTAPAYFYDSARAAINFLNAHALPELFPALDFRDPVVVEAAIRRTLVVAGNPDALVYALGAHPLLLLRVLEWIDLNAHGTRNRRLRHLVLRLCDQVHARADGSALGFLGKALSAALRRSRTAFAYQQLSADAIGSQEMGILCRAGDPEAELLLDYLGRTGDDMQPPSVGALSKDMSEIVFVCQFGVRLPVEVAYGAFHAMTEVARYAQRVGCRVLVLGLADTAFGFVNGLPFIGARDERALAHLLRALRVIDAVVTVSRADVLAVAAARRRVIYQHDPRAPIGAGPVRGLNSGRVQVVCVSEFSRAQLEGLGIKGNLLQVVRNGYDREAFHPDAAVARALSRRHSLGVWGQPTVEQDPARFRGSRTLRRAAAAPLGRCGRGLFGGALPWRGQPFRIGGCVLRPRCVGHAVFVWGDIRDSGAGGPGLRLPSGAARARWIPRDSGGG